MPAYRQAIWQKQKLQSDLDRLERPQQALDVAVPVAQQQAAPSPLLQYRSEIKRAIVVQLIRNPNATDLEICRGLDADGAVELPDGWKSKQADRLFASAYTDRKHRNKIEAMISSVRSDLRKVGLLPSSRRLST